MEEKKKHNLTEKITFIAGLAILLTLISFLVYHIFQRKSNPPELHITTVYQPLMKNYGFKVEVENKGEETAENTNIKLSLYQEGKAVADGTVVIDYVPVKSKVTSWILFHSPRKAGDSLVVSSVTFIKP